ncbi:MAG TPA: hypothetical protein VGX21_01295 [Methylomirabilota bacterium]|nr:hypothetical protein [Methylomirabilota bacterium]
MDGRRYGQRRVTGIVAALAWLAALALSADANGPALAREAPWAVHLRAVDDALADRDLSAAEHAWRNAYIAALGTWRWEGLLEVGDAYLRIGTVSGLQQAATAKARNLYLTALFRARQQSALDGVLQTAEAFARLGDRDMVAQCVRIAESLAADAPDPGAPARVHAFAARLANVLLVTGEVRQ